MAIFSTVAFPKRGSNFATREYDIWDDGSIDLWVEYDPANEILFSFAQGIEAVHSAYEILPVAGYYRPVYLRSGALTGGTFNGIWDTRGFLLLLRMNAGSLLLQE